VSVDVLVRDEISREREMIAYTPGARDRHGRHAVFGSQCSRNLLSQPKELGGRRRYRLSAAVCPPQQRTRDVDERGRRKNREARRETEVVRAGRTQQQADVQ
jgi:hypothetical protein